MHGIRYLDLRVGYDDTGDPKTSFFLMHEVTPIRPMFEIFQDINAFFEMCPKELVIVDFHKFHHWYQWDKKLHNKFVQFLKDSIPLAKPVTEALWPITYNKCLKNEYNLMITHRDHKMATFHSFYLFPNVEHVRFKNTGFTCD